MLDKLIILIFLAGVGLSCASSAEHSDEEQAAIRAIMDQQEACWNQGDLECFMVGYWPSDSLMYIGSSGITYGYDNALARYQRNYPDRANMGNLTFTIVTLDRLSSDAYHMVGKWALKREVGDIGGHFTLLFRKIDGEWVIVKDHSSQTET